jgi:hypothetical protein
MIQNVNYTMKVDGNNYTLDVDQHEYKVTLSRTGGQGSRGHSVTDVYLNEQRELLFDIEDSSGNLVETVNVGSMEDLVSMSDVATLSSQVSGDILIYNSAAQTWNNHQLTTSKVLDIDNTNKTDGALLMYDGTTSKYKATTTLDNQNTIISGGNF